MDEAAVKAWIEDIGNWIISEEVGIEVGEGRTEEEAEAIRAAGFAYLEELDSVSGQRGAFLQRVREAHNLNESPTNEQYRKAKAAGMILTDQRVGLGTIVVTPGTNRVEVGHVPRNLWPTSLCFSPRAVGPQPRLYMVVIAGITALDGHGEPLDVFPIEEPQPDREPRSWAFRVPFPTRTLALVGQSFCVVMEWDGPEPVTLDVSAIADALEPYAMQRWMEEVLVQAAQTPGAPMHPSVGTAVRRPSRGSKAVPPAP